MDSQAFINAIQQEELTSAVETTIELHKRPPGRRPAPELLVRSAWFNSLAPADAAHVERMVADAAFAAVFGFLSVLDGVRTIDTENGRFELFYVGKDRELLNPANRDLHGMIDRP